MPEGNSATVELSESVVGPPDEGIIFLDKDRRIRFANSAAGRLLGSLPSDLEGERLLWPWATQSAHIHPYGPAGQAATLEVAVEPSLHQGWIVRLKEVPGSHQDNQETQKRLRQRDEFLAMLSHELRNPLSAIQTATAVLSRADVDAKVRDQASAIVERQFFHLHRIVDDLLDVSRLAERTLRILPEEVDLRRVVREAIASAAQLQGCDHQVLLDLPAEDVWVWGDPTRLEQALVNLINNAAKFTPPNGRIEVRATLCDGQVALTIKDNGPGIPAELMPTIFEPFTQGVQSLDRSKGGLGIGLALADHIVRRHEGSLQLATSRQGTELTVTLPLRCPSMPTGFHVAEAAALPLRILLIEDSVDARTMLAEILRMDGHIVLESSDGIEGLEILLTQRPHIALVDIGLPGIDGYEVARRARSALQGVPLRMIAVTGYGTPHDIVQATEAGFDAHMVKPVRYRELCDVLFTEERSASRPSQ